jgi:hypothetical protein
MAPSTPWSAILHHIILPFTSPTAIQLLTSRYHAHSNSTWHIDTNLKVFCVVSSITAKHDVSCCLFWVGWLVCDLLICEMMYFSIASCVVGCGLLVRANVCLVLCLSVVFQHRCQNNFHNQLCSLLIQHLMIFIILYNTSKVDLARVWAHSFQGPQKIFASIPILEIPWNWFAQNG